MQYFNNIEIQLDSTLCISKQYGNYWLIKVKDICVFYNVYTALAMTANLEGPVTMW